MDAADWARLKGWFGAALESPPERVAEILTDAERESPALAAELRSLLEQHNAAILETAAVLAHAPKAVEAHPPGAPARGEVGRYRILRELGRGGAGVVMLAERVDDEFHRPVALKLLRYVGWDPRSLELLTAERRVLAQLQHPNIAALLDWGTTREGAAWLATEYVDGEPIDRYCRSRHLDVPATLAIFKQVCEAVQYAHRRLVIHRDLKPANVLVTGQGVVKLLDFGTSKLLDEAHLTRTIERSFTPAYASPEQIRGGAMTAATDVYGLGLLLYELLAGTLPHATESLADVMQRLEREAPPPSEAPGLPASRRRALRGDLDRIVLHALAQEAERRYPSVEQLLADIERYERGYPILAVRPSTAARAAKFLKRHAVATAAAVVALAALVGGGGIALWNARVAGQQRAAAEKRFVDLHGLARAVMFDLHDGIRQVPGSMEARRQLITIAVRYLDGLAAERIDDDRLQLEVAGGFARMGYAQGGLMGVNLGDTPGARRSYGAALRIADGLWNRHPDDEAIGGLRFAAAYNLSLMIDPADGAALARRYASEADAWARRRQSAPPLQAIQLTRNAAGRTLRWLGAYGEALEQFDASEAAMRRMLPMGRADDPSQKMFGTFPARSQMAFDLGQTYFARTETLLDMGRLDQAQAAIEQSVRWFAVSDEERAREASNQRMFARVHGLKAEVLRRLDRLDEAAAAAASEMSAAVRNAADGNATAHRDLAEAHRHIGTILLARGRQADAAEHLRMAVETMDRLATTDPTFAVNHYLLAGMLNDYGEALAAGHSPGPAAATFRRALEAAERAAAQAPAAAAPVRERQRTQEALARLSRLIQPERTATPSN